jgi:hypothetical protein
MTSDELEKLLLEYRPSAKLYLTSNGRTLRETTVIQFVLLMRDSIPHDPVDDTRRHSRLFFLGLSPTILRERRGDVSLGLSAQAEMKFNAPYSDEWLELELR